MARYRTGPPGDAGVNEMKGASDKELLERWRAEDDQRAFTEFVNRYWGRQWCLCLRCFVDHHRIEDVLQTAWMRIVRSVREKDPPGEAWPWIARCTGCVIKDELRRDYRRGRMVPIEEVAEPRSPEKENYNPLDLDAFLSWLDGEYVQFFGLLLEGWSQREAAAKLGWTEEKARQRKRRVIERWIHRSQADNEDG